MQPARVLTETTCLMDQTKSKARQHSYYCDESRHLAVTFTFVTSDANVVLDESVNVNQECLDVDAAVVQQPNCNTTQNLLSFTNALPSHRLKCCSTGSKIM